MKTFLVIAVLVALVLFVPGVVASVVGLAAVLIVWLANLAYVHWLAAIVVVVVLYLWLK